MRISKSERAVIWSLFVFAIIVNIAGYVWDLYDRFWWFDEALHLYTSFALTLALALRLYSRGLAAVRDAKLVLALTVASVGIAVGTLWEVGEWGYDQFVPTDVILGKTDTIVDLMLDTAGAAAAALVILGMVKR